MRQLYGTSGLCMAKSGVSSEKEFYSVRCQFGVSNDVFKKRYPLDSKTNSHCVRLNQFCHTKWVKKS